MIITVSCDWSKSNHYNFVDFETKAFYNPNFPVTPIGTIWEQFYKDRYPYTDKETFIEYLLEKGFVEVPHQDCSF